MNDCVRRKDVIDAINKRHLDGYSMWVLGVHRPLRDVLLEDILAIPSAEPEEDPVPGRWIDRYREREEGCSEMDRHECSECGYRTDWIHRSRYCPECGKRMVEE